MTHSNRRRGYHRFKRRPPAEELPPFKPGVDRRLRRVFAQIGVPAAAPFVPDAFQEQALAVVQTADCLVTAPTGAGKTWIASQAMARIFEQGGRCWYASPLKALTNSKFIEFGELFGSANLGILTGDRKENPQAPLLVGTTEILRNQLYDAMERGESFNTDLVVLDEAHFLGDIDRGVVWEEIMIYLPSRIPLLLLSATIGNADDIADWLAGLRGKPCQVVSETRRPVPLYPLTLHPNGTLLPLLGTSRSHQRQLDKRVLELLKDKSSGRRGSLGQTVPLPHILAVLKKYDLLPAIFFLKSRADCDRAVSFCAATWRLSDERRQKIAAILNPFLRHDIWLAEHRQLSFLQHHGLGSHHSGQLPNWKLLVENLMTEGCLDAVFATSTVAAGVNFPARTIVFLNSDRFNGKDFQPLNATEYHQMTGRAGRRGKDLIGFALAIPGPHMNLEQCALLVHAPPAAVVSQIRINFSMVLNLLLSHTPDQIEDLLEKSFAAYQLKKWRTAAGRKGAATLATRKLIGNFRRHLLFLQHTGYVDEQYVLTVDGRWASQLRVDQPLLLAEGFRQRSFPDESPALMAALMSVFVNERVEDNKLDRELILPDLLYSYKRLVKSIRPLIHQLIQERFFVPPLLMRPAIAVYAWANGESWNEALYLAEVEEGDLAMLIMRTADHLRQVRGLREVFPRAANAAAQAIELILRSPVVMDE